MSNPSVEQFEEPFVPAIFGGLHEGDEDWPNPQARGLLIRVTGPDVDLTGVTQMDIEQFFSNTVFPVLQYIRNQQNESNERKVAQAEVDKAMSDRFTQMRLYISGLDFETIAGQMGLQKSTVRTDINRTLRLLHKDEGQYGQDYFRSRLGDRKPPVGPREQTIGAVALLDEISDIAGLSHGGAPQTVSRNAIKFLRAVIAPEIFPDGLGSQAAAQFIVKRIIFPAYVQARMIDSPVHAKANTAVQTMTRIREVWLHVQGRGDTDIAAESFASTRPRVLGGRKYFIQSLAEKGYDQTYFQALLNKLITTEFVPEPNETVEQILDFSPKDISPRTRRRRSDAGMKRPRNPEPTNDRGLSVNEPEQLSQLRPAHEKSRAMLKKLLGNDIVPDSAPLTQGQAEMLFDKLFFPMFEIARARNRNNVEENVPKIIMITRLYIQGKEYKDILLTSGAVKKGSVWEALDSFVSGLRTAGYTEEFLASAIREVQASGTWPTELPIPLAIAGLGPRGKVLSPKKSVARDSRRVSPNRPSRPRPTSTKARPQAPIVRSEPIDLERVAERLRNAPFIPSKTSEEMDVNDIADEHELTALTIRRAINELVDEGAEVSGRIARGDGEKVTTHYSGVELARILQKIKV